jgi:hypothetical protein
MAAAMAAAHAPAPWLMSLVSLLQQLLISRYRQVRPGRTSPRSSLATMALFSRHVPARVGQERRSSGLLPQLA